jgi:hypothetical protein
VKPFFILAAFLLLASSARAETQTSPETQALPETQASPETQPPETSQLLFNDKPLFQQRFALRIADEAKSSRSDSSFDLRVDDGSVHERIAHMRAARHNPTERGLWFSRGRPEDTLGRLASDAQYPTIMAQGFSLMQQGDEGERLAWQGFRAVAATGLATVLVKKTWRRRRPYPNDHKFGTFPSGHTSTVFAMAAVYASARPEQKWMALGSASLVGWSRVKVRAHHWHDVLAGAALGYAIGKQFAPDKPLKNARNTPLITWQMAF